MSTIKKIIAREIIDSRGQPTIEGKLWLADGRSVETSVPAGTSVSKYEAVELRDNDPVRYGGMGVLTAISYINNLIGPKLVGVSPLKQYDIDQWLLKADATKNKSRLGGNTTLVISQLATKAGAMIQQTQLFNYVNQLCQTIYKTPIKIEKIPTPIFNILNGGAHAHNNLEFQEFQIVPSSSLSFANALKIGVEVFHELKQVLIYRNANVSVGEEGGFAPNFPTNVDALEALSQAIIRRNLKPGLDIFYGLDIAASQFYRGEKYFIKDRPGALKPHEYIDFLLTVIKNYPFLTLEDPVTQDDIESWKKLNIELSKEIYLIGDDLIATNKERLLKVIQEKACSSVLVKLNQAGTVTETLEVIDIARRNNLNYVVSHRSGETNDSFVADFAVGVQSDFVKFGAPSRGERVAKYNRLSEIEVELGQSKA